MAQTVCADPCSFQVNTDGKLALRLGCGITCTEAGGLHVNTGDVPWPHACPQSAGAPVYCDTTTAGGRLHVDPEKFHFMRTDHVTSVPGERQLDNIAPQGQGVFSIGQPLLYSITNPSTCRAMELRVQWGIQHYNFQHFTGEGDFRAGQRLIMAGSISFDSGNQSAHARARSGDSNQAAADFSSSRIEKFILPANGTVNIAFQPDAMTAIDSGNNTMELLVHYLDVLGFSV